MLTGSLGGIRSWPIDPVFGQGFWRRTRFFVAFEPSPDLTTLEAAAFFRGVFFLVAFLSPETGGPGVGGAATVGVATADDVDMLAASRWRPAAWG